MIDKSTDIKYFVTISVLLALFAGAMVLANSIWGLSLSSVSVYTICAVLWLYTAISLLVKRSMKIDSIAAFLRFFMVNKFLRMFVCLLTILVFALIERTMVIQAAIISFVFYLTILITESSYYSRVDTTNSKES